MTTELRDRMGFVRGWVEPKAQRIHAMKPGGWTLCRRRPGKDWYENGTGFIPSGFHPEFMECLECERALPPRRPRPLSDEEPTR